MRDYGKVHTRFWASDTARNLSDMGRLLALYLITSPHSTIAGVFSLPDGYICEDMQWTAQQVSEGFVELLREGFANRCETTKWVWVKEHLKWNPPENPNQRKAAVKVAVSVPDKVTWKPEFMRVCGPSIGIGPVAPAKPSITVVEPLLNQKQKQEQKQEQEVSPAALQATEPASGFTIPLTDGTEHEVSLKNLTEWRVAFPAVDVEQELREMRVWCNANKENRKTSRGVERFIVRWLQKAQDTPARNRKQSGDDWTRSAA